MIWNHTFPDKNITGSNISIEDQEFILSAIPKDLTGKSILDLAAFDGFYSYEATKRGAKFVVALDNGIGEEIIGGPDQGVGSDHMSFPNPEERQKAFDRMYEKYKIIGAPVHLVPMNVEDMDKLLPEFDIVFCFGLFYHVKDIFGLFEKCYQKCKEMTIIEGAFLSDEDTGVSYLVGPYELHNDPTNFWIPSPESLFKILWRVGFKKAEVLGYRNGRILLRAYKNAT